MTAANRWEAVPPDLADRDQWIPWRWEQRGDKPTKVPLCTADPRRRGSSTDSGTWGTSGQVMDIVASGQADGAGFVITADDDFVGVDIDGCRNPETDELSALARDAKAALGSYAEVTPSGRGIRIWVRAPGVRLERKKYPGLGVEVYTDKRFFAVTGERISGARVEERSDALVAWWDLMGRLDAVLKRARRSGAFAALYDEGDTSRYDGDDSSADLALCNMLVAAGGDRESVDKLFRYSALMREKWDRDDYRERTLDKAFEERGDRAETQEEPLPESITARFFDGEMFRAERLAETGAPPESAYARTTYSASSARPSPSAPHDRSLWPTASPANSTACSSIRPPKKPTTSCSPTPTPASRSASRRSCAATAKPS